MLKAFRTLYESKGLEFDDVSSPPSRAEFIAIVLPRFSFTTSLRTQLSISLSGVLFSMRSTVRRFLLQLSMKIAMLVSAPRFVASARFLLRT
jgi:hypothetical protein